MLKSFRVHNFKSFLNFEIQFTRRHLLVGRNNSGKSNLCQALSFLGQSSFLDYDKIPLPGGLMGFLHRGYKPRVAEFDCACELPWEEGKITLEYSVHVEMPDPRTTRVSSAVGPRTVHESLKVVTPGESPADLLRSDGHSAETLAHPRLREGGSPWAPPVTFVNAPEAGSMLSKLQEHEADPRIILFKRFLSSFAWYSLSPALIRYDWTRSDQPYSPGGHGGLYKHGQNLPFVLHRLKNENEPSYRRLVKYVERIEPDLDSINFWPSPDGRPIPYVILKDKTQASWDSMSDGTLSILALALLFIMAELTTEALPGWPPPFIMVEEPENSLYRGELRAIWEDLAAVAPQAQFIFTSHSPYFVDLFDRDLESVTKLKKEGGVTTAKPLTLFRDRIAAYRDDFSLGELYYKDLFE
ncbi:MAG: AAA family ATPase [Planctomycetes bacterium]|nr:AAA family ATPase [Planctomycetota bacterium]